MPVSSKHSGMYKVIACFANLSPYHKVIAWLNCLPGKKGFIFHSYCPSGSNEYARQYLSDGNGQKIDAIRQQIQQWHDTDEITENEYYLLLLPLLEATSKVANISGTYGAYLKHWDPRTHKKSAHGSCRNYSVKCAASSISG